MPYDEGFGLVSFLLLGRLRVSGDREQRFHRIVSNDSEDREQRFQAIVSTFLAVLASSADNSSGLRVPHSTMRKPDAYPEIVDAPDQRGFTFEAAGPDRARHRADDRGKQWRRAWRGSDIRPILAGGVQMSWRS